MFTLNVVWFMAVLFVFGAMLHYRVRALKAESFTRNAGKLIHNRENDLQAWKEYALKLETQVVDLQNQAAQLSAIYHTTYSTIKDSYGRLLTTVKSGSNNKPTNGNGNNSTHKDNTSATTTTTTKTAEVSTSIAPQDDHEKNLVSKWQDQGKAAEWINSQLTSIQSGKAKRANVTVN